MLKKALLLCCVLAVGIALSGCRKKASQEEQPQSAINIAYSAFTYDQGYLPAEGWIYETCLTDEGQMDELNRLMGDVQFDVTEETFELGHGYQIVWRDKEGNVEREEVILSDSTASRDGMIFHITNAQALYEWLEALKLREQTMG